MNTINRNDPISARTTGPTNLQPSRGIALTPSSPRSNQASATANEDSSPTVVGNPSGARTAFPTVDSARPTLSADPSRPPAVDPTVTRDLRSRLANQQEEVTTAVSAMASGDIDVQALYLDFVAANPGQRLLDQVLLGEFPAEFFEGPAGQLQMMIIQDAMQARTNFMNMMTNMMKKNDEAAGSIIGNMR